MRRFRKVAVLGSGVMGTGIACHLANAGLEVILLDILPRGVEQEKLEKKEVRNSVAATALQKALKHKPAPLYHKDFAQRISPGNFDDDLPEIKDCDWIIEVVVERLDIKQSIFEKVDNYRRPGSVVSSNTSGIPIHSLVEGRSEDFTAHFLGTHFFNPPRYLELLEVIPTEKTSDKVTKFIMDFGENVLGKETVLCKDTPAFIANRVGVYSMAHIFQLTSDLNLTIWDVDKLTGPAIGRPKSGTFRLADLVGLDVAGHVVEGMRRNSPDDAQVQNLTMPDYFSWLIENENYGNKTGAGFYRKSGKKDEKGRSEILGLDLSSREYTAKPKSAIPSLDMAKQVDVLSRRLKLLYKAEDLGGKFLRKHFSALFSYVSHRIPEISDTLYAVDQAMRAGYGWELGPFEYWDTLGVEEAARIAEDEGYPIAPWVKTMLGEGKDHFYLDEGLERMAYDPVAGDYRPIPGTSDQINLTRSRGKEAVYKNDEVYLHDIGDQVLCLEFTSKQNAIGEGILRGMVDSIELAEKGDWRGIVIGNQSTNFSVGANIMLIGMFAFQEEWDELAMAVRLFQQATMRCRYSSIPVVAASQGYVFGGACETLMHCDGVVAAAESYIGLVEAGIGLIPAGAGTKEFALRISDEFFPGDVQIPTLIEKFKSIALAQVSTSAVEAFDYGYLSREKDEVILRKANNIQRAKELVLQKSEGYIQPQQREDIQVLGRQGIASLYTAIHSLFRARYASEHDVKIAQKIAWVLCGGDLSEPQKVTEQYLLELELEAFLNLAGEQKTKERIQYMLENNRPLRN